MFKSNLVKIITLLSWSNKSLSRGIENLYLIVILLLLGSPQRFANTPFLCVNKTSFTCGLIVSMMCHLASSSSTYLFNSSCFPRLILQCRLSNAILGSKLICAELLVKVASYLVALLEICHEILQLTPLPPLEYPSHDIVSFPSNIYTCQSPPSFSQKLPMIEDWHYTKQTLFSKYFYWVVAHRNCTCYFARHGSTVYHTAMTFPTNKWHAFMFTTLHHTQYL